MTSVTQYERVRFITADEYKKLLNAARADQDAYMLFLVVGNLGLRGIEARRIRRKDVLEDAVIRIRTAKQREDVIDEMSIPREVYEHLKQWMNLKRFGPEDLLFPWPRKKIYSTWRKYAEKSGIINEGIEGSTARGMHCLRHMLGVRLADANAKPSEIRNILRHRALSATLYYLHVNNPGQLMNRLGSIC